MNNDISWLSLTLGSLILIIPFLIFHFYKTKLNKAMIIAFLRMAIQLALVGVYLKYIFILDSTMINILWVLVMIVAATFTIVKRSELNMKYFLVPLFIAFTINILVSGLLFSTIVLSWEQFFSARYIIPITGMIIGNCLTNAIIGLRSFYNILKSEEAKYRYFLACGATKNEALMPFFTEALKSSFAPTIASTATIGLIWLPGMMTGQILGGSEPMIAIKYQIIIMIAIFTGSVITVYFTLLLSKRFAFNDYCMVKEEIYYERKKG